MIEDEEDILDVLDYNLSREGFLVTRARDGAEGLRAVRDTAPELVVLDLMLPVLDGIELCRAIKRDPSTRSIPVIMLTAKGDESDIVLGLGVGADDYVTKPFSPKELVARVKAVLRRGVTAFATDVVEPGPASERVALSGLVVDTGRHEVLVDGERVYFTRTELALLHVLAASPGRVFSRDHLVMRVMGDNAWVIDRTIDVHIRAIRKKLAGRAYLVETIRGVGYRFRDERR